MRASGATEAAIQAKTVELEKAAVAYDNPLVNVAETFMEPFPVGLLITLISAAVLRRKGQGPGTGEEKTSGGELGAVARE